MFDLMQLESASLEAIRNWLPLLPAPPLRYHTPAELHLQCDHGDKLENYVWDDNYDVPEGLTHVLAPKRYDRDGLFSTVPKKNPVICQETMASCPRRSRVGALCDFPS